MNGLKDKVVFVKNNYVHATSDEATNPAFFDSIKIDNVPRKNINFDTEYSVYKYQSFDDASIDALTTKQTTINIGKRIHYMIVDQTAASLTRYGTYDTDYDSID